MKPVVIVRINLNIVRVFILLAVFPLIVLLVVPHSLRCISQSDLSSFFTEVADFDGPSGLIFAGLQKRNGY
jgi:hypothetical protein